MRTIPQLFEDSVNRFSGNSLIYEKKQKGDYKSITYKEVKERVDIFACGLIDLGLDIGDRVALISEGRSEWLISELSVLYVGGISVPLSTKILEAKELIFRIKHSGCRYILVSRQQLEKVRPIISQLESVEKLIVFDESDSPHDNEISYSSLMQIGQAKQTQLKAKFNKRWKNVLEDDIANISYTSGTTADPKGIMLTHRNYTANTEQANSIFDVPEWYTSLLILSWDHSFAHTVGLYGMIKNGGSFAVVEQGKSPMDTLRNIPKNIREIKPVFQLSVPALARSFKKNIESGIRAKGSNAEKLFNHALKVANKYHGNGFNTGFKNPFYGLLLKVYDKILFSKVRENFGGRLKFFIGGGALLDIELQHFFYAIGIPMYQGYGLTEASPVISSNTPRKHKLGTSGIIVENLEVKILDDDGNVCKAGEKGEIVVKGDNVMKGYWDNESATSEALKDGWLFTGDLGYFDDDGFLYVLGRFKSLLISNDGEKYSPEGIEEAIVEHSKLIDQCMLYNNQDPYTVGLFVLNASVIKARLKKAGIKPESEKAISKTVDLVEAEINKYYAGGEFAGLFPERWLPTSVGILSDPFTEENGLINSTLKMVRPRVTENHKETLDFLYTPEGKSIDNKTNRNSIKIVLHS